MASSVRRKRKVHETSKQRRERIARQVREWSNPKYTGEVLTLEAHGASYSMYDFPSKMSKSMQDGHPYEPVLLEYIYRRQFNGKAVDVGANVGNHTMWFAAVCGLQVIAFEPIRYRELARNAKLNGMFPDGPIRIHPVALGSDVGGADASTGADARFGKLSKSDGTQFPVMPLDEYRLDGISLIKIDVEGWEPEVLRGAEQTIRRNKPVIFTEQWTDKERSAIAAILEPMGYRLIGERSSEDSPSPVGCWDPPL